MTRILHRPTLRVQKFDLARMGDIFGSLYKKQGVRELHRIRKYFGLNRAELARMLRVSPQALGKWERSGVPPARLADVHRCSDLAAQLAITLKPERLPGLVRTRSADFRGRTVLDVIRDEGPQPVADYMRRQASGIPR